ncbi:anti-sigma-I factor RsgI6-like [Babylonia areolata]|uniref:anti-sigma-I factor RsgI6-like n=1 Tax=Babylonia areolata TaxID=304850 RepID=UPI003FD4FA95
MERGITPLLTMMVTMMMMTAMSMVEVFATADTELPNMLLNPSYEEEFPEFREDNPWEGGGVFTHERICTEAVHGRCSLRVADRQLSVNGAMQMVSGLKPGRGYALTGHIKLQNDKAGTFWQSAKASLRFVFLDSPDPPEFVLQAMVDNETVPEDEITRCKRTGEAQKQVAKLKPDRSAEISYTVAYRGFVTSQQGWVSINGDINAPMRKFADQVKFTVDGPDPEVDFLLDDLRLVEMPDMPDWRETARTETEKHRMGRMDLTFQLPPNVTAEDVDAEVKLKSHLFAFGAKVEPDCVVTHKAARYNEFLYNVFNWVTIGSYKWRMGQELPGPPDFSDAIDGTATARAHGLKVRAHSILWGVTKNVPEWVTELSPEELHSTVWNHIDYIVSLAKGKVEQVDVQNEYIHGHFYENKLQNPNFTMEVFKHVRTLMDPEVKLYLNDFMGVTTGAQTEDMVDIVTRFRRNGVPIDGIGIQAHTKDYVKPDPAMIWHRLNKFKNISDLDVMVTEFDLGHNDDVIRADWLEDAYESVLRPPGAEGGHSVGLLEHSTTLREQVHGLRR